MRTGAARPKSLGFRGLGFKGLGFIEIIKGLCPEKRFSEFHFLTSKTPEKP